MKQSIIKNSFLCGLLTFAINFLFVFSKAMFGVLICACILPGFVYAIVVSDFENNKLDLKRLLFITFSGALYIFVAWIATGYSFLGDNTNLCFPVASITGAILFLTLYYLLIDRTIGFSKGLFLAIIAGLLSTIPALIGDRLEQHINDYDMKADVNLGFTLLVFPIWQTLFGWIIYRVKNRNSLGR